MGLRVRVRIRSGIALLRATIGRLGDGRAVGGRRGTPGMPVEHHQQDRRNDYHDPNDPCERTCRVSATIDYYGSIISHA
jgi:hypothetical protein